MKPEHKISRLFLFFIFPRLRYYTRFSIFILLIKLLIKYLSKEV